MATIVGVGGGGLPDGITLSSAQTGNGASTNVVDRGGGLEAAMVTITTAIGATPSVTVDIQGSADGVNWFNAPYSLPASPATLAVAALTITTAGLTRVFLAANFPWRYLRLNYSANTNVTITDATAWIF
jgi:hypothetical protein